MAEVTEVGMAAAMAEATEVETAVTEAGMVGVTAEATAAGMVEATVMAEVQTRAATLHRHPSDPVILAVATLLASARRALKFGTVPVSGKPWKRIVM